MSECQALMRVSGSTTIYLTEHGLPVLANGVVEQRLHERFLRHNVRRPCVLKGGLDNHLRLLVSQHGVDGLQHFGEAGLGHVAAAQGVERAGEVLGVLGRLRAVHMDQRL